MVEGHSQSRRARARGMQERSQRLAVAAIHLLRGLPHSLEGRLITGQMLRSVTSVAANYRAACRARSRREFTAKLGLVIEECDETMFWLDLMRELGLGDQSLREHVWAEGNELLAIFVVARSTALRNIRKSTAR